MAQIDKLERLAGDLEAQAHTMREAIKILVSHGAQSARASLNGKLKSAAKLRAHANGNGHHVPVPKAKRKPSGLKAPQLMQFMTTVAEPQTLAMIREHFPIAKLSVLGYLKRLGHLKRRGRGKKAQYSLTPLGRRVAAGGAVGNGAPVADTGWPKLKAITSSSRKALRSLAIARVLESEGTLTLDQIVEKAKDQYKQKITGQAVASAARRGYVARAPEWTPDHKAYVFVARPKIKLLDGKAAS